MRQTGFAYAQTRIQARFAARPSTLDWQLIETSRDFSQALDSTRRGAYADTVTQLGRDSGRDAIEAALLQAWIMMVSEVTAWAPAPWRPALLWFTLLPQLRLVIAGMSPPLPGAQAIDSALKSRARPGAAWMTGFKERLPCSSPALMQALEPVTARFLEGPPQPSSHSTELVGQLALLLRSHAQQPAAVFAWLGLVALDLESLRGALLLARLFPAPVLTENQ